MKDDLTNLEVILDSIKAIEKYIGTKSEKDFLDDDMLKHAVLMRLIVIGEYGTKLSASLKDNFVEIEWQTIKAARNFYVHVYDRVNFRHVWDTINDDIPKLKPKISKIISALEK